MIAHEADTRSQMDLEVAHIADQRAASCAPSGGACVVPQPPSSRHPLSHGQRALWFLQQLAPASAAYNVVRALRTTSELDVSALQRAFQRLVDRHPALRTTFTTQDGEPVQQVYDHMAVSFQAVDATSWSKAELDARLASEAEQPFDLEKGPLMRIHLFSRGRQEHVLLTAFHHIVTDLWSQAILFHDLGALYRAEVSGLAAELPALPRQFTDYVREQAQMLAGPAGERLWAYWRQQLAGELPTLNLPTDRPRPAQQTFRGASQSLRLGTDLGKKLRSLSQAQCTSPYVTLLAAFQVLLHHYTGQEDILVGTPTAGRSPQMARVVGYFVNPVAVRTNLAGDPPFIALLRQVRETALAALDHSAYPFPLLVERLQPARDPSRSPVFQVMFAWEKTARRAIGGDLALLAVGESGRTLSMGDLRVESLTLEQRTAQFDLTLLMAQDGDDLLASLEYNTDLFDAATAAHLLQHFRVLLESIVADPEQPISALSLLTPTEARQLLVEWNDTDCPEPTATSIQPLFEAQVERTPESVALLHGEAQWTYSELNRRANRLAHRLRALGAGPGTMVGVFVERSPEAVAALLAILKAGSAYVPLDPAYPGERLAFMLADAQVPLLLTQERLAGRLPPTEARVICIDSVEALEQESEENPPQGATAESPAYVIYTSGSTGKPKGVVVSHGALAGHCWQMARHYRLEPHDRVLQFASFSFDTSLEQILPALIARASVVVREGDPWTPEVLYERIFRHGITVINLTPAHWHQLAEAWRGRVPPAQGTPLRLVIIGGDVVPPEAVAMWLETPLRDAQLLNAYGPTEATVTAATFAIQSRDCLAARGTRIPIGRPLARRQVFILDRYGHPVPVGVAGELHIGGAALAQGYLHQPQLTAERFIASHVTGQASRLYRTGDLARYRPDGTIEFLGRIDDQVKIRGFRVELAEIEATLAQHPALRQVTVVARGLEPQNKYLVAYVVPQPAQAPSVNELRNYARARLPEFMVPSAFVTLDALPLTASGKVDRRALPEPEGARNLEGAYVGPRTAVEADLASIWAQVLGVERVGIYDDFFALGGHSLLATQVISRLRQVFRVEVPLSTLFAAPTIASLAVAIVDRQAEQSDPEEVASLLAELDQLPDERVRQILAEGGKALE